MVDYAATAEFYSANGYKKSHQNRYRRFASVSEAVRYAIEVLPRVQLRGALLEVDEQRFEGLAILALYTDKAYPLERRDAS